MALDAADTLRAERAQRNGDDTGWLVETKQGDTFTDVDVYDDGDVIVSTGGKNVPPRSVRVSELWAERDRLKEALRELVATVRGECPSILNEDSGGNAALDLRIDALLTPTPTPETPASTKER